MKNQIITTQKSEIESYKGMKVHAASGLHEDVSNLFLRHVKQNSSVLDIGAGAGAFSQRLYDLGFKVTALDIDEDKWRSTDVSLTKLDINAGLSQSLGDNQKFDAICCLEVIEHIENPWQLFRDACDLLDEGGVMILSTPNITSFLSRLFFQLYGNFPNFGEASLAWGHINPLTDFEILNIAKNTGWETIEVTQAGYLPIIDFSSLKPRRFIFNVLRMLSYVVCIGGQKKGYCLAFVFRKCSLK